MGERGEAYCGVRPAERTARQFECRVVRIAFFVRVAELHLHAVPGVVRLRDAACAYAHRHRNALHGGKSLAAVNLGAGAGIAPVCRVGCDFGYKPVSFDARAYGQGPCEISVCGC